MALKKIFCSENREKMSNMGFKIMAFMFRLKDVYSPVDKRVKTFNIKKGMMVIDYGCGPGRYLKGISEAVGSKGRVYAADIHELAIESVKKKIKRDHLDNVEPVLVNGSSSIIKDHIADMICVLDMFHMIKEPISFLKELHRLLKKDGFLIIDDGHQPRVETKTKISNSKIWNTVEEAKDHLKCVPLY